MDRARRIRRLREGDDDRPEGDDSGGGAPSEGSAPSDGPKGDDHDSTATETERDVIEDETEMEWGAPGGSAGSGADAASGPESDRVTESAGATESAAVPDEGGSGDISAPLPETDQLEAALADDDDDAATETVTPEATEEAEEAEEAEETRVLEFTLGDEHYCLDIEYIEEIVKEETITRVPNTPEFVEGVVDLRGQITTILNPKVTIDKPEAEAGELIVVFDSDAFDDQGHIGWVVDDVRQVSLISGAEVNEPPIAEDHVNGVIDCEDDDGFVVWTSPDLVFDEVGA
jgi:purine-binding chemotaxis protein CheW